MIGFLDLPGEVRNAIYDYYVPHEGALVLDPQTNKLKVANGGVADLALMFTCKKIASEVKSYALPSYTITFQTYSPPFHLDWRDGQPIPDAFEEVMQTLTQAFGLSLDSETLPIVFFYTDIAKDVSKEYPSLAPYVELLRARRDIDVHIFTGLRGSAGQTPSVFRRFARFLMQEIVADRYQFGEECLRFEKAPFAHYSKASLETFLSLDPEPWSIPTSEDILRMKSVINALGLHAPAKTRLSITHEKRHLKPYYSAAAVAIRFLKSMPAHDREHLRNIVLEEDHPAVAFSECHAQGLIPFCQENPRLRIDRRANLWRTVFQTTTANYTWYDFRSRYLNHRAGRPIRSLHADSITYLVGIWTMEALELQRAGMPPGSFTLTFTGGPGRLTCSEIFKEVVWRDTALQSAIERCLQRNIISPISWAEQNRTYDSRQRACWWLSFDGFPQAVRDMFAGESIVRCDFPTDCEGEWDAEDYIRANSGINSLVHKWFVRPQGYKDYEPEQPSPFWEDMLSEDEYTVETSVPTPKGCHAVECRICNQRV